MALLLAGIVPAGAVGEAGTIEACRKPGVASITDGKPIDVPAGTMFADLADERDRNPNGDTYRPVRLRLLQPLEIGAAMRCGSARAEIYANPQAFNVGPGEHRAYGLSGHFAGPIPELVAHVVGNFR
ncbi:MAG: hypothetical protein ABSC95_24375 [Acetobacteraceae bacterium]